MTEPLKDLLDPDHVKTGAKDLTCIIDPLLTEEINRATQLVQQVQDAAVRQSATARRDDVHIATTFFLHVSWYLSRKLCPGGPRSTELVVVWPLLRMSSWAL